jgi:hypothetical protein
VAVHYYTADKLINSIRRSAQLPVNNNTFKEEDYLELADEELSLNIVPSIIRQHENYFLYTLPVPMEIGKSRYKIPSRATGNKLKDLTIQDPNGQIREMTMIPLEHITDYQGSAFHRDARPIYYVLNDEIVLFPETVVNAEYTLLFTFYIKPNKLVKLNQVAIITAIDALNKTITVNNLPAAFNSTQLYDFVTVQSPHVTLGFDVPIVNINAGTKLIQFDPAYVFPERLAVGDHMCIQNETAIPQIPSDLHPMLAKKVAIVCQQALGDTEGVQTSTASYNEIQTNVSTIIDNRVESAPKKLVNRNSFMRRSAATRRGR